MDGPEPAGPDEVIPYIKCDACMKNDHGHCIGRTHTRPFCGCRCPWLEVIDDDTPDV